MILADDAVLFREGLARLLGDAGWEVTGLASDAESLLQAVAAAPPDVVITDIRMPPTHTIEGLEAAHQIRRLFPGVSVLVLSQYLETRHVADLIESGGGVGYVLKERVTDALQLVEAIQRISEGGTVIDPEIIASLVGRQRGGDPLSRLSERELEVLSLMAEGLSNAAIAQALVVTGKTVETHVGNIFGKLNLPQVPDEHRRVRAVLAYLRR